MNIRLKSCAKKGSVTAPVSKSYAHRILIAKALSDERAPVLSDRISTDIEATESSLGQIKKEIINFRENKPISRKNIIIDCRESASTLRFLLPIAGALGINCEAVMGNSLFKRPMDGLIKECSAHGMNIIREDDRRLLISGKLKAGEYTVPGDITSQYITGLLFALPLLKGSSTLKITGDMVSKAYIALTEDILNKSGINFKYKEREYFIPGSQNYSLQETADIERDWSLGGVFLCMGAFSPGIKVSGLNIDSRQGDKAVIEILQSFHGNINISGNAVISKRGNLTGSEIEAADIPDIVPALSIVAAGAKGVTIIRNVSGLRYKESDRIRAIIDMIHSLGGAAEYRNNHLIITGKGMLHGGVINSYGDHRIAMAGAVASCICKGEVEILDYRCTDKSYPDFWDDFKGLEAVKD